MDRDVVVCTSQKHFIMGDPEKQIALLYLLPVDKIIQM